VPPVSSQAVVRWQPEWFLHDYLHELANSTSLHLPMNDTELEELRWKGENMVRESAVTIR